MRRPLPPPRGPRLASVEGFTLVEPPHPRPRLLAEDGFTLVELLIAVLVLTVGLLALIGGFDSARKLNVLSERRTSMAHRAQLEIERLEAIPYAELGMASPPPAHSAEVTNPDFYVNPTPATCTSLLSYGCYAWNAENIAEQEALVPATSSPKVAASPTGRKCSTLVGACEWEDGPVSGNVYDFVTWAKDKNCTKTQENYKRLTVAVTAKVPSGNRKPAVVRVSTLVANPAQTNEQVQSSC
jgi:prepilin-type N-terminal cleavage/methylation domain-containing protein